MICPIYIIHLKRNPERKLYMQRQLDAFGLDYRFVEVDIFDKYELKSKAYRIRVARMLGIDKQALENKYAAVVNHAKKHYPRMKYRELASLAIGLSHIKVYNLMIENNHEMACILEDDVKLLPTFPEVLKTTLDLEWDILQFCHQPDWSFFYPFFIRYFREGRFLKFPNFRLLFSNDKIDKRMIRKYGFDNPKYSKLAKYIKKTIQLHNNKYESMMRSITRATIISIFIPGVIRKFLNPKSYVALMKKNWDWDWDTLGLLETNTIIELGMFPKEPNTKLITEHHCIAEPREQTMSTTAYLVRQSAIAKLKQELLSENSLAVDQIPWRLYKNGQVKLRIISPPCATTTYYYLKYTMRRSDIHLNISKTNF